MSWVSSFLRKTGLNKPGKFVAKAASLPVRGIGRMARGKFGEGLSDIAGGAARTAALAAPWIAAPVAGAAGGWASSLGGTLGIGGGAAAAGEAGIGATAAGVGKKYLAAKAIEKLTGGGGYEEALPQGTSGTTPASSSGMSSLDKWGLGLQALGMGADIYGGYQQGRSYDYDRRMEDEDRARNIKAGEYLSPWLKQYMEGYNA